MKLTVKLLNIRPNHVKTMNVYQRRSHPFKFQADAKNRHYAYTVQAETPQEMQMELDELFDAVKSCEMACSILIDPDTFHALTGKPRASMDDFKPEDLDLEAMDKAALTEACGERNIPVDRRNTEAGLREKLRIYFQAQADLADQVQLSEDKPA